MLSYFAYRMVDVLFTPVCGPIWDGQRRQMDRESPPRGAEEMQTGKGPAKGAESWLRQAQHERAPCKSSSESAH
jgi:hypothetical protein